MRRGLPVYRSRQNDPSVNSLIDQMVDAYKANELVSLDQFLPHDPTASVIADLACQEIELRIDAGLTVRVLDYLNRYPQLRSQEDDTANSFALYLLEAELLARERHHSLPPTPEAYINDFPHLRTLIENRFRDAIDGKLPNPINLFGSDEEDHQPLPSTIGPYHVSRLLGKGNFGRVYLAHDSRLNRLVAIKVPRRNLLNSIGPAIYQNEALQMAQLDHPNIIKVYEAHGDEQFPFYVVFQYIEGTDLDKRLQQSRLPLDQAIELVAKVADALHYAHRKKLVHRDIKPANLILDANGNPHVADFGLALHASQAGRDPGLFGSPAYASPEQVGNNGDIVDGRSDIYSLGTVLYELITGQRPFQSTDFKTLQRQIINMEAKPPRQIDDTIPAELERICIKALAKNPKDRYTTGRDMAKDLRKVLDPKKRFKRNWLFILVGALLSLCTIFALSVIDRGSINRFFSLSKEKPSTPVEPNGAFLSEVRSFELLAYSDNGDQSKLLGKVTEKKENEILMTLPFDARVVVQSEFSRPVYAFLIALDANGAHQLCWPLNENAKPDENVIPPQIPKLKYPNRRGPNGGEVMYALNDEPLGGLQAFAVVISDNPLPSYKEWKQNRDISWERVENIKNPYVADESGVFPVQDGKGAVRGSEVEISLRKPDLLDRLRRSLNKGSDRFYILAVPVEKKK